MARATNDRWNITWALSHSALLRGFYGTERSVEMLDESVALFRELNDPMGLSHNLVRRTWLDFSPKNYPNQLAWLENIHHCRGSRGYDGLRLGEPCVRCRSLDTR